MRVAQYIFPLLLATTALTVVPVTADAQVAVGLSITIAPPVLPVYVQPPIPATGYIWTPGYWAYGPDGYYWVPGTWVMPPSVGLLWTPGYWGWNDGVYVFNSGYWGPTVGFYGGINYGYGYGGSGYDGGRWDHGHFAYNSAVNNFGGRHITNVYNHTVINTAANRASFNGGAGGIAARPTAAQLAYAHQNHVPATREQTAHFAAARADRSLLASQNHGHPPIAATARPGELHGPGVVAARNAAPARVASERAQPQAATHPQVAARPAAPHPQAAARPAAPHPQMAARPAAPRPQMAARPAASRPQMAARPAAPRPQAAARPAAPRPQAAARPAAPRPQAHAAAPRPQAQRRPQG